MKKLYSIRTELFFVCALIVVIPAALEGIINSRSSTREINQLVEDQARQQALMVTDYVQSAVEIVRKKVQSDLNVAHDIFYSAGTPVLDNGDKLEMTAANQITKEKINLSVPVMKIQGRQLASSYEIVDRIQKLVGGTATVFQMFPGGALRISTNVLNSDGTRAVNTYIPSDSPVYKAVSRGETYFGRAFVVNAWYQTAYEPIKDGAGAVIGMLYVGVEDAMEPILKGLSQMVIGKTGYIFILDEKGSYVLSHKRERDGENIAEAKDADGNLFVQEILKKGPQLKDGETGITYYSWKNPGEPASRMKFAGYAFFPEWRWIVASSVYPDDSYAIVRNIKMNAALVALIAIIAGAGIAYLFGLEVLTSVKKLLATLSDMAKGDLSKNTGITTCRIKELNDISVHIDRVIESLRATVHLAGQIADGDMTVQITTLSDRDALGHALQNMVKKLSGLVSEIDASAANVAGSSAQLNATSQAMSQGATEQASSLEEITSSMNEITSQTRLNAEHATQANRLSVDARGYAQKGNQQMTETVAAMRAIRESSGNISKIIKVIDEIAFQTNLLALNAAVEAARAGRHGKGFAVVAEEVRSLAARSAKAAKETAELIEGAVKNVEDGSLRADKTAEALNEILTAAGKVTDLVAEIAAASNEQAQGIGQITAGLGQIDQVTQQNTAHAEQAAAASQELTSQAHLLQRLVRTFIVEGQSGLDHIEPETVGSGGKPMLQAGAGREKPRRWLTRGAPWGGSDTNRQ